MKRYWFSISLIVFIIIGIGTFYIHSAANQQPQFELIKRSEEHTSELQSRPHLVCRLLLEKKKSNKRQELSSYLIANLRLHLCSQCNTPCSLTFCYLLASAHPRYEHYKIRRHRHTR